MEFYNFLIEKLKAEKERIPTLAKKSGVKNTTIHSWLSYGKVPPVDKAEKVLKAMGYEIEIVPTKKEQNGNE